MKNQEPSRTDVTATVSGNISGQVAVGSDIRQSHVRAAVAAAPTSDELASLRQMLSDFRTQVQQNAPAAQREAAVSRVDELSDAITAAKPDLTTMDYVRKWFAKNIPTLAGGVVSIVVNPIVGKLVQVGGDALVSEFRERFGVPG